jgi:hypothetical protein
MLDTGATTTIIDTRIRQSLNLTPFRILTTQVPSQPASVHVLAYKADLLILHPSGNIRDHLTVPLLTVMEMSLSHLGADILIGCDVLSLCTFMHDGQSGRFLLSY